MTIVPILAIPPPCGWPARVPPRPLHERLVKTHDEEIVPVWNARFEALVRDGLPQPLTGAVLELGCGTGTLTAELLRRHQGPGRIVSIDPPPRWWTRPACGWAIRSPAS